MEHVLLPSFFIEMLGAALWSDKRCASISAMCCCFYVSCFSRLSVFICRVLKLLSLLIVRVAQPPIYVALDELFTILTVIAFQ